MVARCVCLLFLPAVVDGWSRSAVICRSRAASEPAASEPTEPEPAEARTGERPPGGAQLRAPAMEATPEQAEPHTAADDAEDAIGCLIGCGSMGAPGTEASRRGASL